MKVLVVGGGGREHALVWKLAQSPDVTKLYCAPGNGGIGEIAELVPIGAMDVDGIVNYSKAHQIDLVVVAPDDPLAIGMVDALETAGIKAFGPRKNAAVIEASKVFAKELMKKYRIPTADYRVFDNSRDAMEYVSQAELPLVVKADGLALGKGVLICHTRDEAIQAVRSIMEDKKFGSAGQRIVVEEFLTGPEVSVLAFTDGRTIKPMVSVQDHKRAFDQDKGPNTGGMGTFSPSRVYTEDIARECMETIFRPTVEAMNQEGRTFKGVLYFGLMLTEKGPRVLEYNARFGDPETQVVMPRLKTDLLKIMQAVVNEELDRIDIEWHEDAAVCVVMASGGYPEAYEKGFEITGLDQVANQSDIMVFHAGTKKEGEKFLTNGGRVLGVTARGSDLEEARRKAYDAVSRIHFKNAHYRRDIGIK
ncbi:MAG TPA: phosphoribosylamine--glycine ligase [Thermoclostridium caenicola]|uniref:phosphoribosylamine--glycine ligase n=1 Tax=Thermoclostridium caenicola TaxID=659425 RepID=UPI002D013F78|nr:phosphoribosylamine--glycine ligase [Thermoclostridium caenicola]HOL83905.1 phosphoribosylamine--glycine ligase [Thermoclostridium caenicola]HPO77651.1 phosphoribosylamine--glycine ligase [Thermoclostridium caenicola]HPU21956.1 phosphoribosylamine--glycine ligase [Thermoclostridium caenicola]